MPWNKGLIPFWFVEVMSNVYRVARHSGLFVGTTRCLFSAKKFPHVFNDPSDYLCSTLQW